LFNNLSRGGTLTLARQGSGIALAYDNLFDSTSLPGPGDFTGNNNGYITNKTRLTAAANDKVLTNSPVYLTSYLGSYYYPTNDGMLSTLINAGSRYATNATLYHYCTTTNQVKEAGSMVDIGFHWVAVDPSTGLPYDADGDGIPDYLEDTNGNGVFNSGETDWTTYNSPNGLTGATGLIIYTPLK